MPTVRPHALVCSAAVEIGLQVVAPLAPVLDIVMVAVVVTVTVMVPVVLDVLVFVSDCDDVCVGETIEVFQLVLVVVGLPVPVDGVVSEPAFVTVEVGVPVGEVAFVVVLPPT